MVKAVHGTASPVEQLSERVWDLERRLSALERKLEAVNVAQAPAAALSPLPARLATKSVTSTAEKLRGAAVALGKAVLGIAGAYLLRAVAESNTIPPGLVLALAVAYAVLWMVWAVRAHASNRFASAVYGITATLILSPLVWESTTRFRSFSPAVAAMILAAFFALTLALARRRNLQVIPGVAAMASVSTAWALIFATDDLAAFTAALLAITLATELSVSWGHALLFRAVPAIAADLAVWLLVVRITSVGLTARYPGIAPLATAMLCLAPFAIYGGSIAIRGFALRDRVTVFEIVQGMIALLLMTFGALNVSNGLAAPGLGALFLILSAACYWGAFWRFVGNAPVRNRLVCSVWAPVLAVAGSVLLFASEFRPAFLCLAALVAALAYLRRPQPGLGLHADLYLATAAAVSALPGYVWSAFAGNVLRAPHWSVWIVLASAVLCYGAGSHRPEESAKRRLLWMVPAVLVGSAAAALAVAAIVGLLPAARLWSASRLSVVRTSVTCAVALAFGLLGSRWRRRELTWVAYTAVALGALKLVAEDLRFGNAASLMVSLVFYGLVLVLLPRVVREAA